MNIYVVLPIYNEEKNIVPLIENLNKVLIDLGYPFKIVTVNDGSTDKSKQLLQELSCKYPIVYLENYVNSGLGETLKKGLKKVVELGEDEDVVVTMDADNTHEPGYIPYLIEKIREGADVAIASRFVEGGRVEGVPWWRSIFSWGASFLFKVLCPIDGVTDYSGGFRAYRVRVLKEGFLRFGEEFVREKGFACMAEILLKLREYRVEEVPYTLKYHQKKGASKIKIFRTILGYFRMARRTMKDLKKLRSRNL